MEQPLHSGAWHHFSGPGYRLDLTQFSNKGQLIVVKDQSGREIGRARFSLDGQKWILDPPPKDGQ